jgi:hypothetical protein
MNDQPAKQPLRLARSLFGKEKNYRIRFQLRQTRDFGHRSSTQLHKLDLYISSLARPAAILSGGGGGGGGDESINFYRMLNQGTKTCHF